MLHDFCKTNVYTHIAEMNIFIDKYVVNYKIYIGL